jgi:hypothetical protein
VRNKKSKLPFERSKPVCILSAVSKLTKVFAMLTLALWGLAAMHCTLEGVPGFDFLKTCCFVESAPSSPQSCDGDTCGEVEKGSYRAEEQTASVPPPTLVLVLTSSVVESPLPELQTVPFVVAESPPGLTASWQFDSRSARLPRAPSSIG